MEFARSLIQWYHSNKRDLPWRLTRDPYRIWLSEIILQQTRVVQGMSYYHHFLEKYPTVLDLAASTDDEVMKSWQGLGYYSRARNLLRTARQVANANGQFPENSADLIKLPGVGSYTAAAIASFCFDEPVPVVDGNVIRVLSRYFGVLEPVDSPEGLKIITALAHSNMDTQHPALYNQAVMEFGALQCKPGMPDCNSCPIQGTCFAARTKKQDVLPFKRRKTKVQDWFIHYYAIGTEDACIIHRRPENGIWGGLYQFPCVESDNILTSDEARAMFILQFPDWIENDAAWLSGPRVEHILTHRRIIASFTYVKTRLHGDIELPEGYRVVSFEELQKLGVSRLIEKGLGQGLLK